MALPKGRATPSAVRAVWGVNGHRDPLLIDARPAELERNLVTSNLDQRSCFTLLLCSVSAPVCLTAGVRLRDTLPSNRSGAHARGVRLANLRLKELRMWARVARFEGDPGTVDAAIEETRAFAASGEVPPELAGAKC